MYQFFFLKNLTFLISNFYFSFSGCDNVCFNSFSPISNVRLWGLQLLSISIPITLYLVYIWHVIVRTQEENIQIGGKTGAADRALMRSGPLPKGRSKKLSLVPREKKVRKRNRNNNNNNNNNNNTKNDEEIDGKIDGRRDDFATNFSTSFEGECVEKNSNGKKWSFLDEFDKSFGITNSVSNPNSNNNNNAMTSTRAGRNSIRTINPPPNSHFNDELEDYGIYRLGGFLRNLVKGNFIFKKFRKFSRKIHANFIQ